MGKKKFKKRFIDGKRANTREKTSESSFFIHITREISWKIVFIAITIVIMGYILLAKVDPVGKNIYSYLAPVFLIGGHILVALGLLYKPETH